MDLIKMAEELNMHDQTAPFTGKIDEIKNISPQGRLERIDIKVEYITKQVDNLVFIVTNSEKERMAQWLEYKVEHSKLEQRTNSLAIDLKDLAEHYERRDKEINSNFFNMERATDGKLEDFHKALDALEERINPLLFAHKILVWISVAFGVSVIGLIWAIITHAVQIVKP